jgi:hypothetical protein
LPISFSAACQRVHVRGLPEADTFRGLLVESLGEEGAVALPAQLDSAGTETETG